jgi:ABC-2 type transport system permease protein
VFEISATAMIGVALMAIFLVVRHTRGEEEAGRTELLRASVLGRSTSLLAPVLVVSAAALVVGLGIGMLLISIGLPVHGSLVFGVSAAAVGIVFTAVGAVAAQVTTHARGALGIASAVLGVAFVVRGIGDVAENGLSWASPLGWSQAARPFADDRWWPLGLSLIAIFVLLGTAGALEARRDLGAGLIADRPASPIAAGWLAGPTALAARLQRGSVVGWTAGLALTGLAFGSFGDELRGLVEDNPTLAEFLGDVTGADLVDAFLNTAMFLVALMAAGFAVASALRLHSEEEAHRAEPVLATAVSRSRWAGGGLAVTIAGTVIALGAGGLGTGVSRALDTGDAAEIGQLTVAALAYVPAVLVLASIAVLIWGWLPRLALVPWAALGVAFVVGYLGELLSLPGWLVNVSPFSHVAAVPLDNLSIAPLLVEAAIAVGATALGVIGFRRRDLAT